MSMVVTLAERHRRKIAAMQVALQAVDARIGAYARTHGGRFIRFGSTATGRLRAGSDVDIIADFADDRTAIEACRIADEACVAHRLQPDCRPACWVSARVLARALAEGVVLG